MLNTKQLHCEEERQVVTSAICCNAFLIRVSPPFVSVVTVRIIKFSEEPKQDERLKPYCQFFETM
jgi:hypothetical protein